MPEEAIADVIEVAPTPVQRLDLDGPGGARLWVKRDDLTHAIYGGNKVRKLRHILADAKRRGAIRVVTFGAAGSHHVLATTLFASRLGMRAAAILTPQHRTSHATDVLRAALVAGLEAWPARFAALAPLVLLTHRTRGDRVVPPGGSNKLGAEGFVDAVAELAGDIARGELPDPDVIVVPVGSGGTAAGIACGVVRVGLRARVHGVSVLRPPMMAELLTRSLIRKLTVGDGAGRKAALGRLSIDGAYAGAGYGIATDEGRSAGELARAHGILTDPTYTEKALAAALELARRNPHQTVVYWHTLSSAPMEPLLAGAPVDLPPALDRLFID